MSAHLAHPHPKRKHNRPIILFVTLCTSTRGQWLANEPFHGAFREAAALAHHWSIGRYVIMPDHVHLMCRPAVEEPLSIKKWSTFLRSAISKLDGKSKSWRWQPDVWDTQMRDREHYGKKLAYMEANPARAGLVENSVDWPLQGTLHDFVWL